LGIVDITEKKTIEEKLKTESLLLSKSEQKFRQIVENSNDIFFYFDMHTRHFKYISPKLFDILGYSSSEVIPMNPETYLEFIHPDYRVGFENMLKNVIHAHNEGLEVIQKDFKIKSKAGNYRWLSGSFCITNNTEGKPNQLLGSLHDITKIKEYEDELTVAKEKAQESDRLKSVFLANLSHEIRTPMNGILGFAGLMKTEELDKEEYLTYVDVIEKSGKRLLNLINELINISKIEAGQFTVTKTQINIYELLDELYQFFSLEARTKGLELRISTLGITKQTIFNTDKDKIYEVLINLIKNALKYTDSGFVEIGVEKHPNSYYFYVSDSGRGIPEEKQSYIFERFRQVEETNFREGTGLGLSIAKGFVELMEGNIGFTSEVGLGSRFWIDLPIK
ncbi:MAG: PAS domain S-box protein, partial [Bacteroidales bacterium]|nr:PAS domain S-box protein [Bacteroidales bacterium]